MTMPPATSHTAAGCAQETTGALPVSFSESGFQRTPSRTPTAAQATTTPIESGWSVPSGSGGSVSGPVGVAPPRLLGGLAPDFEEKGVGGEDPPLAARGQQVGDPPLVGNLG